ncbi:MAG: hypothetical protein K2Q26_00215 [Bdellovibrionales bacterium]|nr:hypothetical protein [Bdellovibrionales bacterium]
MAIPTTNETYTTRAHAYNHDHPLICWKSILAGLFVAMMSMMAATALGLGVAARVTRSAIENESHGSTIATGTGIWIFLSVVVSLFFGGFYAARAARISDQRVGGSQSLVVASLFFILLVSGGGNAVVGISSGVAGLAKGLSAGVADLSQNPMIQDTVSNAIPQDVKTDQKQFVNGLTSRLLRGDVESAKVYFALNTGISSAEAEAKINELNAKFEQAAKVAGDKAAKALSVLGWTLFVTFLIGLAAAVAGGVFAARCNLRDSEPLAQLLSP